MTSVTMYHNPRCSKSRQTLALLEENGIEVAIVEYLKEPLTANELKAIAGKLGVGIRDIVRTGEEPYKEGNLANASDDELLSAMASEPILMQRPIVVKGDAARVGRPPESVLEIL